MQMNIHPPIGSLIDVGGHRLHLHMTGAGTPTVVLEAGGMSWSLDWHLVQPEIAKFASVCSYDRAGFGWSDPGPSPRTSRQIVLELHALLEKAGLPKPYILVGASFGGHTARLFASQYPGEVAGIVLVDARHEDIDARMPPAWGRMETAGKGMCQVMLMLSQLGVLGWLGKLAGDRVTPPILRKLPPGMRSMYLEVGFQPKYFQCNLDELSAVTESDRQVATTGSLGSLPLVVIRHGIPEMFAGMPAGQAQQAENVWQELQMDLSRLSLDSQLIVAENSGHRISIDQPELVVESVRKLIKAAHKS